jgi:hypothetical protein
VKSPGAVDAESLVGRRVAYGSLALGSVSAVLVDEAGLVLGVEVSNSFRQDTLFLPWPAASLTADGIQARPLVMLSGEQRAYYERRGARRVVPSNGPVVGTQVSRFDKTG